jgi:hypothetical protein
LIAWWKKNPCGKAIPLIKCPVRHGRRTEIVWAAASHFPPALYSRILIAQRQIKLNQPTLTDLAAAWVSTKV